MKKIILYFLISGLFFNINCFAQNDNANYNKKSTFGLKEVGNKTIYLPEKTSRFRNSVQYFQTENKEYLFYFDRLKDMIYCIDYKTGKAIEDKTINIDVPHDGMLKNFFVLTPDSILVLDYNRTSTIYHLNNKGDVKNTYRLGQNKGALIDHEHEPYKNGDELLLSAHYTDESINQKGIISACHIYNTSTKTYSLNESMDYPDFYYKYHWGSGFLRDPRSTACYFNNTFVYSFPVSHDVYVYNVKTKQVKTCCAGSSYVEKISPYSKEKKKYNPEEKTDYLKYALEQPEYFRVLYDPYRSVYYRIVGFPSDKLDINDMQTYIKDVSVIILDKNFRFLGETFLGDKCEAFYGFVNKSGLHLISKYSVGQKIEYTVFVPEKLKIIK